MAKSKIAEFQKTVLSFYKKEGRDNLPWRKTANPYRILVSEVMLQQTQVERVIPYYKAFLKKFPSMNALASASLADVLVLWQGLGYNRRAKMLHDAAKEIVNNQHGKFPHAYEHLVSLPGIGDYTARAVRVFAFNEPETLIETNVRSVFIHHFFSKKDKISDKEILALVEKARPLKTEPRIWYAALMDYGSFLKKTFPNPSRKSSHHVQQKTFKGSDREIRGAIVRALASGGKTRKEILKLPFEQKKIEIQLSKLENEGLVVVQKTRYSLPNV